MPEKLDLLRKSTSRRRVLLSLAAGAITVDAIPAAKAAQISKKSVNYQPTPKGKAECDNCVLFITPAACKSVEGQIDPKGWCMIYAAKAS